MERQKIPTNTITRLSIYLRELQKLEDKHIDYISSFSLSKNLHMKDDQFRKDLSYFGSFGKRGKGYNVKLLKNRIAQILGIKDKVQKVAIVGAGNLGSALLKYKGFKKFGFEIAFAFDKDQNKVGKIISDKKIEPIDNLDNILKRYDIKIGIIATPAQAAGEVADKLVKAGVLAILNFAPTSVVVPKNIKLKNVDLSMELEGLSYYLSRQ